MKKPTSRSGLFAIGLVCSGQTSANVGSNTDNLHGVGAALGVDVITLGNHHQVVFLHHAPAFEFGNGIGVGLLIGNLAESKGTVCTPRNSATRCCVEWCREKANIGRLDLMRDISLGVAPVSVMQMIARTPSRWLAAYMAERAMASSTRSMLSWIRCLD